MVKEILIGTGGGVLVLLALSGIDITPFILLAGLFFVFKYLLDQRTGGQSRRGPGVRRHQTPVEFDDIGGQETAKRELLEALRFVTDVDSVSTLGIRPLRGILLSGPPGTGKTLLAKAAANYAEAAFFSAGGSQFVEMYAGVGAQRIRRLFRQAKEGAKKEGKHSAVVFIDEIEVVGAKRGGHTNHMEYDQTLNELLIQMDGIEEDADVKVLVMAATNRLDLLDPALLRPGRFDRIVDVDLPDGRGRRHILKIHTRNRPLSSCVDLDAVARETYGFSGAHLESVVNEAAIQALRHERRTILSEDFKEAIEKVMMGERLDRTPRHEELERIAYHEAAHAFISELVRPNSVSSVTITSRGKALGYMRQTPMDDPYLLTKEDLMDQIAVCVAGACAEELFFGSRSTGSVGDMRQAMSLAEQIVVAGMSSLGVVDPGVLSPRALHDEMQKIVAEQEVYVTRQLKACRDEIQQVACILLEQEKIDGDEFRSAVGTLTPISEVLSAAAYRFETS